MIRLCKLKDIYKEIGKTNQDMIKDFFFWETSINGEDIIICKYDDNRIIGLIAMEVNVNNIYKTLYVNVVKEFRNRGVAREMIQYQIDYIKANNLLLKNTVYTNEGTLYIKKYYDELIDTEYAYYEDIE